MKNYYLTILFLLFTSLPFAHAQNVCIEPLNKTEFNAWLPEDGDTVTFLVTVAGAQSTGSIELNLTNVSTWEGTCMNKGSGDDADLYFTRTDQVLAGRIRSAMGYCGTPDIESLRRDVQFVRMSSSGYRESHPHDIDITEEAPNYTVANLNT